MLHEVEFKEVESGQASFGQEPKKRPNRDEVRAAVKTILSYIGENPEREGLLETPDRLLRSYDELYAGYHQDPAPILKTFGDGGEDNDEMIVQRNIPFFSMCEHHMLPFVGVAHVAYLPKERIVGLSKLARLVEVYARRLQVQERMTSQISNALMDVLEPHGAACVIHATHMCMASRGVSKSHSETVTSSLKGCFREAKTRNEFFALIRGDRHSPMI